MFKEITIEIDKRKLSGFIGTSTNIRAWVIFAHGSGSSSKSLRNQAVAAELNKEGFGTVLFDLLTPEEDVDYSNRFDIHLLCERLMGATEWLMNSSEYHGEKIGYFGASTGAAAAVMAAAEADPAWPLFALVSRGGRPDLVDRHYLEEVSLPTLLIVGSLDDQVITFNTKVATILMNAKVVLVHGASHLFEEPGTLDEVVRLTIDWFDSQLNELDNFAGESYVI